MDKTVSTAILVFTNYFSNIAKYCNTFKIAKYCNNAGKSPNLMLGFILIILNKEADIIR